MFGNQIIDQRSRLFVHSPIKSEAPRCRDIPRPACDRQLVDVIEPACVQKFVAGCGNCKGPGVATGRPGGALDPVRHCVGKSPYQPQGRPGSGAPSRQQPVHRNPADGAVEGRGNTPGSFEGDQDPGPGIREIEPGQWHILWPVPGIETSGSLVVREGKNAKRPLHGGGNSGQLAERFCQTPQPGQDTLRRRPVGVGPADDGVMPAHVTCNTGNTAGSSQVGACGSEATDVNPANDPDQHYDAA